MALSPVSSAAGAADTIAATGATAADSEQRFLKLLVTQLNNQDPLNPLENAELTSQLAQMSTVSGIEKLNTALQSLITQSSSGQVLEAASLIGRDVLVPGSALALQAGAPAPFAIEPGGDADAVGVDILDGAGQVVRHLDLGAMPTGVHHVTWDGRDDQGRAVAAGNYALSVTASQADAAVTASPLVFERVQSVAQGPAGITLDTGGRATALNAVRLIQ